MAARTWLVSVIVAASVMAGLVPGQAAGPTKLKVTTEGAAIYLSASVSSQKLASVSVGEILDPEGTQGKFYKVTLDRKGIKITGFIYKEYVEEATEAEVQAGAAPVPSGPSQADMVVQIETKIGQNTDLIKLGTDLGKAVENLRPLIAKLFSLDDRVKQKQIASNIYFYVGVALARQGDDNGAFKEFLNMFDVDPALAAETTKNFFDPHVNKLIDCAEKRHKGLILAYTVGVNTEPQGAAVTINGKLVGKSPLSHQTPDPQITLEIEKEGYAPVKKVIFLTEPAWTENESLRSLGRTVLVSSVPAGAKLYLDGRDTGQATDCELPLVAYGEHPIKLMMENYADWERPCQVVEGPGAQGVKAVMTINRYAPFRKMGGPVSKSFKLPKAVVVDASGNIYVADEGDYKVRRFDPELQSIGWTDPAQALRKLDIPAGLALDAQGFLYVTDSANSCVVKFDRNGKQIAKWGNRGVRGGDLFGPTGIAVDKGNDLYVADTGNHRVLKFSSSNGAVKKSWGKQGSGPGEFFSPTGIAVAPTNEVFIVDKGGRVQRFTAEGVFIAEFGKPGSGDGELGRPLGLCLDADGYVYVADTGNSRVLKFSPEGKLIAKLGGGSGASGAPLTAPTGVAVTDKGVLFVSERDIHQVQEFRVPRK
jgi:DNA-binding beta-propeller fold protein YncE